MKPVALLLVLAGCDAAYGGFLGVVPVSEERSEPTQVFLAIDGLSPAAFDRARIAGAFRDWHAAKFITYFPAVSDYSWTRMLRAGVLEGFEIQYYDPDANVLHNAGLAGVLDHPLRHGLLDSLAVYRRFDFLGDGETWSARGYADPEAALPGTLDSLFDLAASRGRRQSVFLAYLMNVDVVSHRGGLDHAVAMLREIDRRIEGFKARHPGRFQFTIFGDHGNAHQRAELVDPRELLREVGVTPVECLAAEARLEAIPIVHVRVNFVGVHTHLTRADEVAMRASRHRWVDLAAVHLGGERFGLYRNGRLLAFERTAEGDFRIQDPAAWDVLGVSLPPRLTDAESFAATVDGRYPDLLYRVASAFTDPVVRHPPQVILSMPDDVSSFGFHLPGGGDRSAIDGFHGALTRGSTVSILASESTPLPRAVRADDLLTLFPPLQAHLGP